MLKFELKKIHNFIVRNILQIDLQTYLERERLQSKYLTHTVRVNLLLHKRATFLLLPCHEHFELCENFQGGGSFL